MMTCAPTATRTRDLLLRSSFRGRAWPAHIQVSSHTRCSWLTASDRGLPLVLARMWHAGQFRRDIAGSTAFASEQFLDLAYRV
jgi:hypothetical protein